MSIITQLITHAKESSVLYVEDEKELRDETEEFLRRFFSVVDLAEDGEAGWQKYNSRPYDIVIADINMPKMSGIELTKAIKADHPEQAIIIVSAHNESEYLLELINVGVEHYVLKPVHMMDFAKVLNTLASHIYNTRQYDRHHQTTQVDDDGSVHKVSKTIAEQKERQNTDPLTGLDNLSALMNTLDDFRKRQEYFAVVILLDIRGFGVINDLYGPASGNQILIALSDFLKKFVQEKGYRLFRLSGDQFVLFEQVPYLDTDKYEDDIESLRMGMKRLTIYLEQADQEIRVDATIGISLGQESPLEHANMALNHAKREHKGLMVYNTTLDMTDEMKTQLVWEQKIDQAIMSDMIIPVYQPIVDNSGNIIKYETLMRVIDEKDGERRLVTPFHFLDIAIENRQYDILSRTVIQKALDRLSTNACTLSINLTMDDIKNRSFLDDIYTMIKANKMEERVIIEITESQSVDNYSKLKSFVERFKRHGVRFAIDDFGSGYSNFQHILEIEPDYIKIDGSLIKDIDNDPRANILTHAITRFSHELGIKVIAEFVHSEAIFSILKDFGVDEFQGFYFSEPLLEITQGLSGMETSHVSA